jgi:type III secretion system YseE family protein
MPRITHLEDALHADKAGTYRDEVLSDLQQAERQLRLQLCAPQLPDAYAALHRQADACASAAQTILTLWGRYHGVVEVIGHY